MENAQMKKLKFIIILSPLVLVISLFIYGIIWSINRTPNIVCNNDPEIVIIDDDDEGVGICNLDSLVGS